MIALPRRQAVPLAGGFARELRRSTLVRLALGLALAACLGAALVSARGLGSRQDALLPHGAIR